MSYRFQSDEPPKINIAVSIKISYPMTPRVNNIEYFAEKKEESFLIVNALKELGITDYKLRYCLVIDGELGEYTYKRDLQSLRFFLMPGPPQWNEIGQFIVQISTEVSKSLPDAAALVDIATPIVKAVFALLHREKKKQEVIGNPSVAIRIDNHSVKVEGPDQKKNEENAKRIMGDLLKERPSASMNRKIDMQAKFAGSSQYKPRRKKRKGRR